MKNKEKFLLKVKTLSFENRWKITPEELEEVCQKDIDNQKKKNKFLIITCPDNPTSLNYRPKEL